MSKKIIGSIISGYATVNDSTDNHSITLFDPVDVYRDDEIKKAINSSFKKNSISGFSRIDFDNVELKVKFDGSNLLVWVPKSSTWFTVTNLDTSDIINVIGNLNMVDGEVSERIEFTNSENRYDLVSFVVTGTPEYDKAFDLMIDVFSDNKQKAKKTKRYVQGMSYWIERNRFVYLGKFYNKRGWKITSNNTASLFTRYRKGMENMTLKEIFYDPKTSLCDFMESSFIPSTKIFDPDPNFKPEDAIEELIDKELEIIKYPIPGCHIEEIGSGKINRMFKYTYEKTYQPDENLCKKIKKILISIVMVNLYSYDNTGYTRANFLLRPAASLEETEETILNYFYAIGNGLRNDDTAYFFKYVVDLEKDIENISKTILSILQKDKPGFDELLENCNLYMDNGLRESVTDLTEAADHTTELENKYGKEVKDVLSKIYYNAQLNMGAYVNQYRESYLGINLKKIDMRITLSNIYRVLGDNISEEFKKKIEEIGIVSFRIVSTNNQRI